MGRPAGWMQKGRGAMRSPGAPSLRNEIERLFWAQIATGITSEKAAQAIGVSSAVGTRWFRHRGGMPLFMSNHISGRYLSFAEREEIGLLRAQSVGVREIARRLGRSPSTVSRELARNAATRCGRLEYRASVAQWKAELVAKRPKPAKLATNPRLHHYVQDRLCAASRFRLSRLRTSAVSSRSTANRWATLVLAAIGASATPSENPSIRTEIRSLDGSPRKPVQPISS